MSEICVNCEQLREQINKYSNQLLIANKLIIILEKFKNYLQEFRLKFDSQIDHKYRQQLINLENDYKEVRNLKQINENIAESQLIISGNEIQNKSQVLIDSEVVLKTNRKTDNNRFEYDTIKRTIKRRNFPIVLMFRIN